MKDNRHTGVQVRSAVRRIMSKSKKGFYIEVRLPKEWLQHNKLTSSQFREEAGFLVRNFKSRYPDVFSTHIHDTNEASYILQTARILKQVSDLPGFERFVKIFNRIDAPAYLFAARIADFFRARFEVGLEPEPIGDGSGRMPDLEVTADPKPVFIECKTIDTRKFYKPKEKEEIARKLREAIDTPNQITIFFDDPKGIDALYKKLAGDKFVAEIKNAKEHRDFFLEEGVHINIIPETDDTIADSGMMLHGMMALQGIMEDNKTNERKPGFVFMQNGRSTGVFGPLVDFRSCLEKKRKKSQTQNVADHPYILAIDAGGILGDPEVNFCHIRSWFQPRINTRYSGILLFRVLSKVGRSESVEIDFLKNENAAHAISDDIEKFLIGKAQQRH